MRWIIMAALMTGAAPLAGCAAGSGTPGAPGTLTTYVHGQNAVLFTGVRP